MDCQNRLALTVTETSELIGIGRTKLYEAIKLRHLKARKYGKRTIILHQDIEDFLNNLESL